MAMMGMRLVHFKDKLVSAKGAGGVFVGRRFINL